MKTLLFALALFSFPAFGKTVTGTASFETHAMAGMMTISGKGAPVTCKLDVKDGKASGTCEADLTALTTGLDMRDDHMKNKYLNVGQYPKAMLGVKDAPVAGGSFAGDLTVKGQTAPVSGTFQLTGNKVHATFPVAFADYPAIGAPAWKGVAVDKTVVVTVDGTVAD